jgi:hypothetical protein
LIEAREITDGSRLLAVCGRHASAHFGGDDPLVDLWMPIDNPSRHRVEKREIILLSFGVSITKYPSSGIDCMQSLGIG